MSVSMTGGDKTITILGKVVHIDTLTPPMQRGVFRLEAFMKFYPAQPAHSTYVRTGTLGRRWVAPPIERQGNTLVGKIGNNTKYGPWVQSERFQTRFHRRTGWRTDAQAVRENEQAIVADFQRAIDEATRG